MSNEFDQFDNISSGSSGANPFDQFDSVAAPDASQTPSYGQSLTQDTTGRMIDAMTRPSAGIALPFGMISDAATEGAKGAYNSLPDGIKEPLATTGNAVTGEAQKIADYLDTTKGGQTIGDAGLAGKELIQNNPNAANVFKDMGTVLQGNASLDAAQNVIGAAGQGMQGAGNFIYNSGKKSLDAAKADFVQDLVLPKETAKVATDQFGNSVEEGINQTRTYQPSPYEQEVAQTVAQLPISPKYSMLKNYNIIKNANADEATNLISRLQQNDVPIPDDDIQNKLLEIKANLAKEPTITGDGEIAANKVINGALYNITNNPQTASGLLQARKDLDNWVTKFKGAKTFNPALDSPVTMAVQQVRQGINDLVDQAVPDVGVKSSLRTQSNYYAAMDNIAPKGVGEASTRLGRWAQRSIPIAGSGLGKVAEGVGGVEAVKYLAESPEALKWALAGGAGYGAYKGVMSPYTRMGIGGALQGFGKAATAVGGGF